MGKDLKPWAIAHAVNGPTSKAFARECDCHPKTIYHWKTGLTRCPAHKRAGVDRAMGEGAAVDWVAYDFEFDAAKVGPDRQGGAILAPPVRQVENSHTMPSQAEITVLKSPEIEKAPADDIEAEFNRMYGGA